jgi:hypothetical protein
VARIGLQLLHWFRVERKDSVGIDGRHMDPNRSKTPEKDKALLI